MDFSVVGGALVALVAAVPAIAAFFARTNRLSRRQNRRLRAIVLAADVHIYQLERLGWTSRGMHPPPRPPLLQVVTDDDEDDTTPQPDRGPDSGAGEPRGPAGGGPRHSAT